MSRWRGRRPAQTRPEAWRALGVLLPDPAKLRTDFALLAMCKSNVHGHQNRKHDQRDKRRPLEQEPEHDCDKPDVLWMAHISIGPGRCELTLTLGGVEHTPRCGEEQESSKNQQVARDMDWVRMRVAPEAQERVPEMAEVVTE